ncbi:hypothetical protein EGH24_12890 [Halonotius terrestris]|uniref:Ribbon-helix-helix protein, copG family n=1 Tax=Halonotius terrestris TaxID=2487750 RepID=A0A8J8P9X9_9EURY|nr:ribbon-helix-helix domain-containing protein [Halonotius terrestris]TQQ78738.1 hypothetical protein EGH24_12890 [Halonotius terrestris]
METFELELPDGMEDDIEEYLSENNYYLNKSELMRDALRHVLYSENPPGYNGSIHVNQQQIDRVDSDSLEDVKSEQE